MRISAVPDDIEPSEEGFRAAELVQLRAIDIDDWSDVRYVHGTSFRTIIAPRAPQRSVDAFMSWLDTPAYVEKLGDADLTGAWLDGQLAGTAGWRRPGAGGTAGIARSEAVEDARAGAQHGRDGDQGTPGCPSRRARGLGMVLVC